MTPSEQDEYIRLLEEDTEGVCVEKCVLLCRSLLEGRIPADPLDLLGAREGSAQGIRIHAALSGVRLLGQGDIHIIDWNASLGFHTMALLEVLTERGAISRVRHISLIHRHRGALARARAAVRCMAAGCDIHTLCRDISAGTEEVELLHKAPVTIHIAGDCPVIDETHPAWHSARRACLGERHIMVWVNKALSGSCDTSRLLRFLPGAEVSKILSSRPYTNTDDHTPMSCRALVWQYEACEKAPESEAETYDPVSTEPCRENADTPEGLARWCDADLPTQDLFSDLFRMMSPADRLLPRPALPPYAADIALVRPHRGLMLAKIIPADTATEDFAARVIAEASYLRDMRRLLAKHLPGVTGRATVRATIRLAVIASGHRSCNLPLIIPGSDVRLLASDAFHSAEGRNIFMQVIPLEASPIFNADNTARVMELLFPVWHRSISGKQITLDSGQAAGACPAGPRWVLGSPASGKTTCLLLRAINAHNITGSPVLVIVPQATALCGMRHKALDLSADFPLGMIHLVAFSDLARVRNIDNSHPQGSLEPTRHCQFRRYHTILIDDAHALTDLEIESIKRHWLMPGGDVCCFANPMEARHIHISMNDAVMLTGNHSPLAPLTAPLLSRLAHKIDPALPEIASGDTNSPAVTYINISGNGFEALCPAILKVLSDNEIPYRDIMLTAGDERLLRIIHNFIEQEHGLEPMTTFTPAKEEMHYQATTRNPRGAIDLHADSLRHQFDPMYHDIKLACATHLQGVNAPCVVILHCRGTQPDYRSIYRMATRATNRIIILSYPTPIR